MWTAETADQYDVVITGPDIDCHQVQIGVLVEGPLCNAEVLELGSFESLEAFMS